MASSNKIYPQNIKQIDEADQKREREKTARTGENADKYQNAPASDINRK